MKKIIYLLGVISFSATPALATDEGFYAAANVGMIIYSGSTPTPVASAIRIGGGYHFNQYLGLEGGLAIVGDATKKTTYTGFISGTDTETLSCSNSHIAVIANLPTGPRSSLFAKLGSASTTLDYSFSSTLTGATGSGSASKTNVMFGLGWQFNFNESFSIRAQYEDYGSLEMIRTYSNKPSTRDSIGVSFISVGGVYNF